MHWGLLAQKDHKDINFASLRLLLVADGANPCKSIRLYTNWWKIYFMPAQVYFCEKEIRESTIAINIILGSLTSCDAFLNLFQSKGLKPEAICPCASSSEALTVSIRR